MCPMLPKSRIAAILSIGLGLALIVWAVLAPRFVHDEAKMPLDLEQSTFTLRDDGARSRLLADGRMLDVPVERQTHMEILPPADGDIATLRVGVTESRVNRQADLDRLINATVWSVTIDRTTGEATGPASVTDQLASPTREVPVNGYWLKFPADAQQTTYDAFDVTLRDVVPAVFEESYERGGREIYVYRQNIEPTNVAQKYASFLNTTQLERPVASNDNAEGEAEAAAEEPAKEQAYLFHSGTRDIHVDQVSGLIVNVEESIEDYYGDADGNKLEDVLTFNGAMSDEDVDAMISQASGVSDGSLARIINYIVLAAGILITLIGALCAFGAVGRKKNSSAEVVVDYDAEQVDHHRAKHAVRD